MHAWLALAFGPKSAARLATLFMACSRSFKMGHSWSTATMLSLSASIAVMKCCTVSATDAASGSAVRCLLRCSIVAGSPLCTRRLAAIGHCMWYSTMKRSTSGTCGGAKRVWRCLVSASSWHAACAPQMRGRKVCSDRAHAWPPHTQHVLMLARPGMAASACSLACPTSIAMLGAGMHVCVCAQFSSAMLAHGARTHGARGARTQPWVHAAQVHAARHVTLVPFNTAVPMLGIWIAAPMHPAMLSITTLTGFTMLTRPHRAQNAAPCSKGMTVLTRHHFAQKA
eukprot:364752-Chlamydomonas_euryale.AAC.7